MAMEPKRPKVGRKVVRRLDDLDTCDDAKFQEFFHQKMVKNLRIQPQLLAQVMPLKNAGI